MQAYIVADVAHKGFLKAAERFKNLKGNAQGENAEDAYYMG